LRTRDSLGLPIIGKLLGHSRAMPHLDADPLLRAANLIGERIESAVNIRPQRPPLERRSEQAELGGGYSKSRTPPQG
jgi:hypothetical protein